MFTRRSFLLIAAAFGASLSPGSASSMVSAGYFSDAATRLRSLIPAPTSAREIGRIYLAQYPEEDGAAALTHHILSSLSLDEEKVVALDRQALPAMLSSCVRADFEKGRTVEVAGWILSRTEARLCALWT